MSAVIVVSVVAALVATAAAVTSLAASAEARAARRAIDRDRHYLNTAMTYRHPRSLR